MLLFRSGEEVDAWCRATGEPRGESVPLAHVWDLARAWYGDRLDPCLGYVAHPRDEIRIVTRMSDV